MKKLLALVLTLCAAGTLTAGKQIGMQLYTFHEGMKQAPLKTLEEIASMGIKQVETASYADGKFYGMEPGQFKATCKQYGMKAVSSHIRPFQGIRMTDEAKAWYETCIAAHKKAGIKYLVMASLPPCPKKTVAQLQELCALLDQVGGMCAKQGLVLGIHNHKHEFETVEGVVMYDYLVQNTSKNVIFELDVYWAKIGGSDPVALIRKYPRRITLLHVKDEKEIGASGLLDFPAIIAAAKSAHIVYYILEQEAYSGAVLPSVKQSVDYLRGHKLLE